MRDRRGILLALLLPACADDENARFFPPEQDGAAEVDAVAADATPDDLGAPTDLGRADVPRDTPADRGPATDRGPNRCPSACAITADCLPCSERPGETFCCVSGLCILSAGMMCMEAPEPGPINENGGDGGDGAAPDSSGPDPFDDVTDPGEDGGMMMPQDDVPDASMDAAGDSGSDGGIDAGLDARG